jgi:hypothetical protein
MRDMPGSISISLGGGYAVALLVMVVIILASFIFYRFTLPPISRSKRTVFSLLRGCALSLLLLLLFEPLLRNIQHRQQSPVIAIMVDNSQSMSLVDGSGDRAVELNKLLHQAQFQQPMTGEEFRYYTFASSLSLPSETRPDSLVLNGETTDLSDALNGLKDKAEEENIRAVVLLTDGVYTTGKNPGYAAEALGIPVYTVGVGDTAEQKDVLIENINTNTLAYAGERVPVDIVVHSSGYQNENVDVSIQSGAAVLDHKVLTLGYGSRSYPVRLAVEPKEEGIQKYTVEVTKLPGELTDKNNTRSVFMKVLKSRLRVDLIAGAPSPDVAAIAEILKEDEHFTMREYVQKSSSEFYGGDLTDAVLDSADCLVLVGFPTAATAPSTLQRVVHTIDQKKTPVLFCAGKLIDASKLSALESILPFGWSGGAMGEETSILAVIPERAKNHPLIILDGNASALDWQKLPPIYKTQMAFHAKPESDVLATISVQNIVFPEPLIAVRSVAHQRSLGITGYGLWRWRLMAQDDERTGKLFPLFLTNAVRWLTTNENEKHVRITPVKEAFTTGEPVQFTAQVYNDQLRPVDNAELVVGVTKGNEKTPLVMSPVGNGRYEGSINGLPEGDYTFTGRATINGTLSGDDGGRFTVGQLNVEFLETRMNKPLLEQIAYRTGAKYFPVAHAESLMNNLQSNVHLAPKELVHTTEIELWNWKYLAAFIVFFFAIEWFLRKRSGMI